MAVFHPHSSSERKSFPYLKNAGTKAKSERGSNRSRVISSFQLSSSFVSLVEYSVVKTEWSAVPSSSNTVKLSQWSVVPSS